MTWSATFQYVPYAFFVMAMVVFVLALKLSVCVRAVWAIILLLCFSKFSCFSILGGNAFNPNLPAVVIWIWDWLYSGAVILSVLGLLTIFFRFRAKHWLLPTLSWGLAMVGLYNGFSVPSVKEIDLNYPDLPSSLNGYRIVQLADLHCSSATRRWRTEAIVKKVNALNPDLICLTGDLADGDVETIAPYLEPIGWLQARDGVFACTGNHEYYFGYFDWMSQFYSKMTNIRFLENECVFPHEGLALAGFPDETGFSRLGIVPDRDWQESFATATNGEFRVLLQHRPKDILQNVRECNIRLQLSGHTHGGVAPIFRSLIELSNGGYSRGLYPAPGRSGIRYLYVSPGCGQWGGFPMRFFNASEITLFTLRRAD